MTDSADAPGVPSADTLSAYSQLFAGRQDVYASGYPNPKKPNKYNYATVMGALTPDVLRTHLAGPARLGVYPIWQNQVRWFAIDFDAPKGPDGEPLPDPFPLAWEEAERQADAFERAGLIVYLERSRSGNGVHLWGFLHDWMPAATVLDALRGHLLDAVTFDRVYPMQAALAEGKPGNLIALPYNASDLPAGHGAFLNRDTLEPVALDDFLASVRRNYPAVIEELAAKAPKLVGRVRTVGKAATGGGAGGGAGGGGTAPHAGAADENPFAVPSAGGAAGDASSTFSGRPDQPISGVLKMISQYGCRFMQHAWKDRRSLSQSEWWVAVGQLTAFRNGREAAHLISRDYKTYSAEETDDLYDRLLDQPPHGCAYIHANFPKHACKGCPMKAPYRTAEKSILELVQHSSAPMRKVDLSAHLARVRARNSGQEKAGVRYGIAGLDSVTALRDAELTVFGAMPSMGKTGFMIGAAISVAKQGVASLIFSAETAEGGLFDRLLAHEADVDSLALRGERLVPGTDIVDPLTAAEWARIEAARDRLNALPLYVNFTDINADQVLANIERVVLENGVGFDEPWVTFFDYLQFGAKLDQESNYERVSRLSTEFKNIAKITNRPVVIFSQLVRDAEGMEAPSLTMFKESGRIEQDADVAMILSGERMKGKKAPRRITIVKQREGESQVPVDFIYHQDTCQWHARPGTGPAAGQQQGRPDLLATDRPDLFGPQS